MNNTSQPHMGFQGRGDQRDLLKIAEIEQELTLIK